MTLLLLVKTHPWCGPTRKMEGEYWLSLGIFTKSWWFLSRKGCDRAAERVTMGSLCSGCVCIPGVRFPHEFQWFWQSSPCTPEGQTGSTQAVRCEQALGVSELSEGHVYLEGPNLCICSAILCEPPLRGREITHPAHRAVYSPLPDWSLTVWWDEQLLRCWLELWLFKKKILRQLKLFAKSKSVACLKSKRVL